MKIPYANCDFAAIRKEGYLYVDKTPFLRNLENTSENHLIFLRPRRFGKSTLISTLENYYDIYRADRFDELFGGLWIHDHPTPNRHKYLVLTLDFSPVDTTGTIEQICRSFSIQIKCAVSLFIARNRALVPGLEAVQAMVESPTEDMAGLMTEVFTALQMAGQRMYLLIDEYDHFGNRLLSDGQDDVYRELVKATGFVRSFYASLKAFTRTSTIARTFITGVSPIMLDDLSSGFNIITHISQDADFNNWAGFTRSEVEHALDELLREKPQLLNDPHIAQRETLLSTLENYYDGYRFSPYATDRMYNSTLVLYFLGQLNKTGRYPTKMLDLNVRTDYGRLYQLAKSTSEKETDTRKLLEEILTHESITTRLVEQFGTRFHMGREQIASLFYYMGMLTLAPEQNDSEEMKLVIPNRVMRELQWEYMSFALVDHDQIRINVDDMIAAMRKMAEEGVIEPLLAVFQEHVLKKLGLRETMQFNEQTMKLMLFAYMSLSSSFRLKTEVEMGQGYCDLLLGVRSPGSPAKYAWIIEAKYVETKATKAAVEKVIEQGYAQIEKYVSDQDTMSSLTMGRELKAGVLVFVGLKDVFFRPWPRPEKKVVVKKAKPKKGR
ncbi:MAG TPA: AAA family ATPase [Polyangium sp.]|nr:AAA family ATPase [Polyangium sp.]